MDDELGDVVVELFGFLAGVVVAGRTFLLEGVVVVGCCCRLGLGLFIMALLPPETLVLFLAGRMSVPCEVFGLEIVVLFRIGRAISFIDVRISAVLRIGRVLSLDIAFS